MVDVRSFPLSLIPRLTLVGYHSKLGAGTDDKTSYHPLFDFRGKDPAERPDCLFCFRRPSVWKDQLPIPYLIWNDMVVLDYKREAVRAFQLPLTISSQIGREGARLEAMLRSNAHIQWRDIWARIMRRGETPRKVWNIKHSLQRNTARFRDSARISNFDSIRSRAMGNHLSSTMTAEMVVKNRPHGLLDAANGSDHKAYIETINLKVPKESNPRKNLKLVQERIKQAIAWAQRQINNPAPSPSIYGEKECTSIEAIVAYKLGSLNQNLVDGTMAFAGPLKVKPAAPSYQFDDPWMEEFFGIPAYSSDASSRLQDPNDPYGLLRRPTVTEAQRCLVDFLLEPTRLQYQGLTLMHAGSRVDKPNFTTNPNESYWQQLRALQSAFEQDLAEVGYAAPPPVLFGLLQLEYDSMTWNAAGLPVLNLVWQTIDSCKRTHALRQRQLVVDQRAKLVEQQRILAATPVLRIEPNPKQKKKKAAKRMPKQ